MKLYADPAGDAAADRRHRRLAACIDGLAVITGAVSAQAFAASAQDWAAHLGVISVHLPRKAAALIVGVSAKFRWPKIVRRLGEAIDKRQPPNGEHTSRRD